MALAVMAAFSVGMLWSSEPCQCQASDNGFVTVIRSYMNLHLWHRQEAMFLTEISQTLGLGISFSTEQEVAALRALIGTLATACAWRLVPSWGKAGTGLPAISGSTVLADWASPRLAPYGRMCGCGNATRFLCQRCGRPTSRKCSGSKRVCYMCIADLKANLLTIQ